MPPIVFLDTNVILDYLENRDREVRDMIAQLLLLHERGKIQLATSVFNIAELIDKEFEIYFLSWCLSQRLSADEIYKKLRSRSSREREDIATSERENIKRKIDQFIRDKDIRILSLSLSDDQQYQDIFDLIYSYQLSSQDALIVATALANKVTYFLSNDDELLNKISDLLVCFNPHIKLQREEFRNSVLEAI